MNRRRRSIANLTDYPIPPREWKDPLIDHLWAEMDAEAKREQADPRRRGSTLDALRLAQQAGEVP